MKSRFYLLDLNAGVWEGKPCVRLWGIDEQGRRTIIVATQVSPYFYFLPAGDPDSTLKALTVNKQHFPKIADVSLEKRRLLGREKTVLRVVCSQADAVSAYAERLPGTLGGTSFDDLRLSARYITDLELTTCGWNECEIEPAVIDGVIADKTYLATTPPTGISAAPPPKLRLLAFALFAVGKRGSATPDRDTIRALVVATDSGRTSILTTSGDEDAEVLSSFTSAVNKFDPDVIVGYGTNAAQWPYLLRRAKLNKNKLTLGRDRSEPHTSMFGHVSVAGRANLDLADLAGGIAKMKVKNLKNLAHHFNVSTADRLTEMDEWTRLGVWGDESGRPRLLEGVKANAEACLELAKETVDYPSQLSAITGLPLDQVMTAAVGLRVDSYLLRVAHHLGELIPIKNEQPFLTYRGALVQEPKTGVHENVAVLDFASMYPSLMKEYNLSPDTLLSPEDEVSPELVNLAPEVGHRFRKKPDGFYKVALTELIEERKRIRGELAKLAADSTRRRVLGERESAVKAITNACYGYAGWAGARWYAREVAESAAAFGRQLITETMDMAKALGLEVIYSDTDSIFVSNDKPKVHELIEWVNPEPVNEEPELMIEQEYTRVLFTEAMKRYAGLREDGTLDIVGLEVVRGDWSEIARKVQEGVLSAILKHDSIEMAIEDVRKTIRRLRNGEAPTEDLVIRKALTRPIEEYRVRAPHVEVARNLAEEGWEIGLGDKISYVIVKGRGALFQKARPYYQVKPEDVDVDYYVENQVKPAAMRILEVFGVTERQLSV